MGETLTNKYRERKRDQTVKMNENEEVVVNGKEVSENSEEIYEDTRRMIRRTARFSVNEEAAVRKKKSKPAMKSH